MRLALLLALLPLTAWAMRPLELRQASPDSNTPMGAPYTASIPAPDPDFILPEGGPATLVIIIDDLGNRLKEGQETVRLPGRINVAVLPHTPHGARLAEEAHREGKEVMLHAPMSALDGKPLGPGGLTAELSETEFRATLAAALATVPHVQGVNNHMGSDLTRQPEPMRWLMAELTARQLYFVDSRTHALTVAAAAAREAGLPHLSRQVFLDNIAEPAAIAEQFLAAVEQARRLGKAVAIGHPFPETIAFLQAVLPGLEEQGVRLATVSEVLAP
ncbi:MAG: divergent polysaccharide deacetylase family protein [Haliea sp.]|uniref:divergent polysaccharide deacetylase family protein n=1 Tax=Haliea sp. TaxID=1932666 RepID=UPI0032EF6742